MNQIYATMEYGKFKIMGSNRKIVKNNTLKKSIIDKGLLSPICVNENFEIVDGQHRFSICRDNKIEVKYFIEEAFSLKSVIEMNSNTKNWKPVDYLEAGVKEGQLSYKIISDHYYSKQNKLPIKYIAAFLRGIPVGSFSSASINHSGHEKMSNPYSDQFKNLTFEIDYVNQLENERILGEINQICAFFPKISKVADALYAHFIKSENYSHNRMLERLNAVNSKFFDFSKTNYKDIIAGLTKIYNHNKRDKVSFYSEEII